MCSFVYQICPNIWLIMSIKSFEVTELSSNLCFNFKTQSMIMLVSVMIMMEVLTTHTWHHALPWCMLFIKSYFLCLSKVWTINYVFTWWCPCKMVVLLTITRVVCEGGRLGAGPHCGALIIIYHCQARQYVRSVRIYNYWHWEKPHYTIVPDPNDPIVCQCLDGTPQASRSRSQFI